MLYQEQRSIACLAKQQLHEVTTPCLEYERVNREQETRETG